MASFTDSITQFNPYVSQLPVDAMVKVGMYKQQQYDQGVQKIQSQIDNVAGMDIAKDSDKRYLQSKLNQLGSKLTAVAAGDFSNQQLVSSVGGMATQVGRDENVQNAVASTAWYKKQKQELDKQYKEGKSSVANVYDFTSQADKWLNNDEVGQRFSGRYSPYVDIDKKFLETFKALHSSETGKDFIYERYTDPITGKLLSTDKLAVAMEREGVEGIDAAKIETALRAVLTPDDLNQMRINGNYEFRNATPDDLANYATKQYESNLSRIDGQIERLRNIAALSDAQPLLQKRALVSIADLEASKSKIAENYASDLQLAHDDPERVKLNIYKEGAINQFANAFSWEKRTTQVLANPQWEGQMQADAAARDQARLDLAIRSQNFSEYDANRKQAWTEKTWNADNAPTDPFLNVLGEGTKNLPSPLTALHMENLDAANGIEQDIKAILDSNPDLKGNRAELQKRLVQFQNGDLTAISGPMRNTAQRILDNRKKIRENEFIEKKITSEVEKENPDLVIKTGLSIVENGKKVVYSPSELYEFAQKSTVLMTPGAPQPQLTDKEKILVNRAFVPAGNKSFNEADARIIRGKLDSIKAVGKVRDQKIQERLAAISGKFVPTVETIDVSKPKDRQNYESIVGNILLRYAPGYGGLPGGDEFLSNEDAVKAQGWFAGEGKGDIQYKRVKQGGRDYMMMMKGSESVLIRMTPEEARAVPSSVDTYGQNIREKQRMFGGSTNATGKVEDAEFQRNVFKNVRKYAVVADLKNDPTDPEANFINLKVKINGTWQPLQLDNNSMTAIKARSICTDMTDEDIEKLLTSKGISFK
jgi:hypothetical protein